MSATDMALVDFAVAAMFIVLALVSSGLTRTVAAFGTLAWFFAAITQFR